MSAEPNPNPAPAPAPIKPEPAVKPEGLPDSFWDATASNVKMGDFVSSYAALSDAAKLREEAAALIPKDHTGYELGLPEGFEVPEGFALMTEGDMRAEEIQKWAHTNGLNPSAVKDLMGIYAKGEIEAIKASQVELAALGANAKGQIADLRVALHGRLPVEQAQAIAESLSTKDAVRGVQALIAGSRASPPAQQEKTPKPSALEGIAPRDRARAFLLTRPKK